MEEPQPQKKVKEQPIQVYQGAKRIHPKLAKGRFANIRIIMILATQRFLHNQRFRAQQLERRRTVD